MTLIGRQNAFTKTNIILFGIMEQYFAMLKKSQRLRKLDHQWTFGTLNKDGYLLIAAEVVHRIVAYAFLGEPPSAKHIVDHKDTNRRNNRPENLRWVTKLENILSNPITIKKIIFRCGSIEAFLKDPSMLKGHEQDDPNFAWMRAVTPEEAQTSWKRSSEWAKKGDSGASSKGASLGEWLFQPTPNSYSNQEAPVVTASKTPNAVQRNWKTPCEFPFCPKTISDAPIKDYAANLKVGETFSRNQYFSSIIEDIATSKDQNALWVLCRNSKENEQKPWAVAQVTFEDNLFVHKNLGSFLEKIGAEKQFMLTQGLEWAGRETIDDFC